MLVTNVSLHPPRAAPLDVQVIETSAIKEILATQGLILAALVDEPAVADDTIDSYLGDIMLEAASAIDTLTAGSIFAAAVDEAVTATVMVDSVTSGMSIRSAMIAGPRPMFINPGMSREASALISRMGIRSSIKRRSLLGMGGDVLY